MSRLLTACFIWVTNYVPTPWMGHYVFNWVFVKGELVLQTTCM